MVASVPVVGAEVKVGVPWGASTVRRGMAKLSPLPEGFVVKKGW